MEYQSLQLLLKQVPASPFIFVGGKGGVGKTSTASALAVGLASQERNCLLVSTDPAHSTGDIFAKKLGFHSEGGYNLLEKHLAILEISPEQSAKDYLALVRQNLLSFLPPKLFARMEKQMELAVQAPGTRETALTDKISQLMSSTEYDHIIFDTAPTGHTLQLLEMPEIFSAWVSGLISSQQRSVALDKVAQSLGAENSRIGETHPRRNLARDEQLRKILEERARRLQHMKDTLHDSAQTGFFLVMTPEPLPIQESIRAFKTLKKLKITVSSIIVNRIMPKLEDPSGFIQKRRIVEGRYIKELTKSFPKNIPRVYLPFSEYDIRGVEALKKFYTNSC